MSYILKKAATESTKALVDKLKKSSMDLTVEPHELDHVLESHLRKNLRWSQSFEGLNLSSSKTVQKEYVDLDYYITTLDQHYSEQKPEKKMIETVFNKTQKHIAIVGEAGMGKTSSMKKIASKCFTEKEYLSEYSCPIIIICRDILTTNFTPENNYLITGYIQSELGILARYTDPQFKNYKVSHTMIKNHIWEYLDNLCCIIIIEGFDELPIWQQTYAYLELNELSNFLEKSKLIITSRTANFNFNPGNIHKFQIAPLNQDQIKEFSIKWLGESEGSVFYNLLHESGFGDVVAQPLILSYMASLYEINKNIPTIPRSVYRQIIDILLYRWDQVRAIKRDSEYSNFEYDTKFTFLGHLAFHLLAGGYIRFDKATLFRAYHHIKSSYLTLPNEKVEMVIDEIRKHTGLIVLSAYDTYQFSHKLFQEYLAGFYISQYNPINDISDTLLTLPEESAMATVLTNNSSQFLIGIIELSYKLESNQKKYLDLFFNRLIKEKGMFLKNEKLGFTILKLWNDLYKNEKITLSKHFFHLVQSPGINDSITSLGQFYKPDYSFVVEKGIKSNPDHIMKITKKMHSVIYESPLYVPLYLIRNWTYVNLKFDHLKV